MKDIRATILIDLGGKTEDEIKKNIDRSRRKNINKAEKEGLVFEENISEKDIIESHRVYSTVWAEGGAPSEDIDGWKSLINSRDKKLFVLKYKNKIIGCAVFWFITGKYYNKKEIDPESKVLRFYAFAANKEYNNLRPNDFMYWSAIKFGLKHKLDFVDLGGYQIKPRGHLKGVNEFKEKWNGKLIYYYTDYPFIRAIGRKLVRNFGFFWWLNKELKKK
jgi:lipid II:glycine glycyltransferase (peptidoglycan interpeptide bridge formation enzyme)